MAMETGAMTSTAYTKGTQAWIDAVVWDYEHDLITAVQMQEMLAGWSDPKTGEALPSFWGGLTTGVNDALKNLSSLYLKYSQIELQREMASAQIQAAKNSLATGIAGEGFTRGYGGINMWTLVAIGGVAVAALLLLKSR